MSNARDVDDGTERSSPDPLIDEVRAARRWVWEQAGSSFEGLLEHLRKIEAEHAKLVVREPTSPPYPHGQSGTSS